MDTQPAMPKTLQQAVVYFSDPDRAFAYAMALRWPDGKVTCPRCGSDQHSFTKTRRLWFCKPCQKQFTCKVGTVMEDSPISLDKWMIAMWAVANCRNGISSMELHRSLGITQKTAWFLLHRIRLAMQNGSTLQLGGSGREVEVDETYIGAKARNMHKDRKRRAMGEEKINRYFGKVAVQGLLERHGEVRTRVVGAAKRDVLMEGVREHVEPGTQIYSDSVTAYDFLKNEYLHDVVNHAEKYVDGKIHTNGLENFWSLLKRGLNGTYVSVEPFHLFRYVDEQAFRYNNRKNADKSLKSDLDRFRAVMAAVSGKRLTYEKLTGKEGEIGA